MAFFYSVNASITVDTLQSWSCRWKSVVMLKRPQFGTLCKQSQAGLTLAVFLIPLEAIILGVALYEFSVERRVNATGCSRKSSSSPTAGSQQ
jgi:hypothetical protein